MRLLLSGFSTITVTALSLRGGSVDRRRQCQLRRCPGGIGQGEDRARQRGRVVPCDGDDGVVLFVGFRVYVAALPDGDVADAVSVDRNRRLVTDRDGNVTVPIEIGAHDGDRSGAASCAPVTDCVFSMLQPLISAVEVLSGRSAAVFR